MRSLLRLSFFVALALSASLGSACAKDSKESKEPAGAAPAAGKAPAVAVAAPAAAPVAAAEGAVAAEGRKVVRIVFVGMQDACPCTSDRIAGSWKALEAALAKKGAVPVERLQLDTQREEVAFYEGLRRINLAPAIYLLDAEGNLVEFLQGEVSEAQVSAALR